MLMDNRYLYTYTYRISPCASITEGISGAISVLISGHYF